MGALMYENELRTATVLSDGSVGSGIANALDGRTSTSAEFATGATREVVFDMGAALFTNTLCVGRNNLASAGATIHVEGSSDNVTYTYLYGQAALSSDKIIFKLGTDDTYRYWKIAISNQSKQVFITDVAIGKRDDLQRDQKYGFISPTYADGDKITPNVTRGQNIAGLTVKPGLKRVDLKLYYYTKAYYTSRWAAFSDYIKQYPFYCLWDTNFLEDAFYCWPVGAMPQPAYSSGIKDYLDVTLKLEGITE